MFNLNSLTRGLPRWTTALLAVVLAGALIAPAPAAAQQVPPQSPPFSGIVPARGTIGLLMTTRMVTPPELSDGLAIAGCPSTAIAVTVNGQWSVVVGGTAPTFVNAPFLAAWPTLAASTGFFVRCEPASPIGNHLSLAPIDKVEIVRDTASAPSYSAVITSRLPSGCARFERIDVERSGDTFTVTVLNRINIPPGGACTAIYGIVTNRVVLSGTFVEGRTYSVVVNGKTTTFVAGSSVPVGGPPAPTNVRLSGALPDTSMTVPPGQGEMGRVTVSWDYVAAVTSFRVYQRDCAGVPSGTPIEVPGGERSFGPLQPCRPGGNIGVSALSAAGESTITWVR